MATIQETSAGPTPAEPRSERLSLWQKIGFGVGDIYGGGANVLVSFYYLVFLTDVVRLNAGLAGLVILISKVYDSVTDPFEGVLADRTRTRLGRRRPYLLAGVVFVFLSLVALFYPANFGSEAQRFAYVVAAYLFFSTVVSIVLLNYNALHTELSLDYNERTALSSARIIFSTLASIACAVLPLEIVKRFPDARTGWLMMGTLFGLAFALPLIATVAVTRERPEFQRPPRPFHWRQAFVEPYQVRTFVIALLMYLLAWIAFDTVSALVVYFSKNYLLRGGETNYIIGALTLAQVIAVPFFAWLSGRTNKRTAFVAAALWFVVVMVFGWLLAPGQPSWVIYAFGALVGLGSGGVIVTIYAILPDIPDVDELRSGERREGIFAAMTTFMRKLSTAVAIFLVSQVIGWAGYIAPSLETGQRVEQAQPAAFLLALRLVFVLLPIVFVGLALVAALRYPLTAAIHQQLQRVLAARRAGQAETPELRESAQALERLLVG